MSETILPIEYGTVTVAGTVIDKPSASDVLVERWFVDHFYNVPGMPTEMFNRFRIAADDLKARLGAKEP